MIDYVIIASDGGEWSMDRVGEGVHYILEFSVEVPYTITELYPGKIVYYDHQTGDNQLNEMNTNYAISMGPGADYLAFSTADACHVKLILTDAQGGTDGEPSGTMPTTETDCETYIDPESEAPVSGNPFIVPTTEATDTGNAEPDKADAVNPASAVTVAVIAVIVIVIFIVVLAKKKAEK